MVNVLRKYEYFMKALEYIYRVLPVMGTECIQVQEPQRWHSHSFSLYLLSYVCNQLYSCITK